MSKFFTDNQINTLNSDWAGLHDLYTSTNSSFESTLNGAKPNILSGLSVCAKKALWATALTYQVRYYPDNRNEGYENTIPTTYSGIGGVFTPREYMACFSKGAAIYAIMEVLDPDYEKKISIAMQGWNGGYIGNHVQMWVFDTNTGDRKNCTKQVLLDPTIGLIARCTWHSVLAQQTVSSSNIHSFYETPQYGYSCATLNSNVNTALTTGLYSPYDMYQHFKNKEKMIEYCNDLSRIKYWATPQS